MAAPDEAGEGGPALGDAAEFYRNIADELSSLSHLSAELTWTADVPLRTRKTEPPKRPAATGRLPSTGRAPGSRAKVLPPPLPARGLDPVGPPAMARHAPALTAEISMKKPEHLAEVRTKPTSLTRRGAQPRAQGPSSGGRRLRLGVVPQAKAARGPPVSAPAPGTPERRPTQGAAAPTPKRAVDAGVQAEEETFDKVSRAVSAPSLQSSPRSVPGCAQEEVEDFQEEATPMSQHQPQVPTSPPPPKARLLEVFDLKLLLPSAMARRTAAAAAVTETAEEDLIVPAEPQGSTAPPARRNAAPPEEVFATRGPSPPVRPVIRGLIADVIDEMRAPPSYQDPAEVSGGVELSPLLASLPPRRQSAAQDQGLFQPSGPAPLDEDTFGRRIGRKPPPYEVAPPPPYDGVNPVEEGLREIGQRKAELQAREKALEDSRLELKTQVAQLAEAQQQAHAQSALFAQAQAAIQSQGGGSSFETQASAILQTMAKSAEDAARRSAESLEASRQVAEAAASAPIAPPPPPQAASPELTSALTSLRDRLERVEAAFAESVRAAAAQVEERKLLMAALAEGQRAPLQMVPLCAPQPPAPPPPARPASVDVATQSAAEPGPAKDQHEARVSRFTDFLLNGRSGPIAAPPPAPVPVASARDLAAQARLATGLRRRREVQEATPLETSQGSSSTSQFRSPGELPTSSDATREAPTRPAKAQMWPSSPGQLPSSEPSSPGEVVGGSEPGEVPAFAGAASVGEVSVGELEPPGPGQGPWAHLDQRSSGEVSSFEVANAS